jgi:hypothetical protein
MRLTKKTSRGNKIFRYWVEIPELAGGVGYFNEVVLNPVLVSFGIAERISVASWATTETDVEHSRGHLRAADAASG